MKLQFPCCWGSTAEKRNMFVFTLCYKLICNWFGRLWSVWKNIILICISAAIKLHWMLLLWCCGAQTAAVTGDWQVEKNVSVWRPCSAQLKQLSGGRSWRISAHPRQSQNVESPGASCLTGDNTLRPTPPSQPIRRCFHPHFNELSHINVQQAAGDYYLLNMHFAKLDELL